ncbi:hypothetical protein V9K67_16295 [Paraflavisolibacter sp. H34]|uniref:hypothetical protein n=1 Tax=Huijunlia imazamoxiresistens TaxID=3127457 RepID=UPI0030164AC7
MKQISFFPLIVFFIATLLFFACNKNSRKEPTPPASAATSSHPFSNPQAFPAATAFAA